MCQCPTCARDPKTRPRCRFGLANANRGSRTSLWKWLCKPYTAPNASQLGTLGKGSYHTFIRTFSQCKRILLLKEVNCFGLALGDGVGLGGVVLILTQICLAIQFVSWPHKWLCWHKRIGHVDKSGREKARSFFCCSSAGLCQLTVTRLHSVKRHGELTKISEDYGQELSYQLN